MPTRPTLCILVDAFRHDYLEPSLAPVLSGLAAQGATARLRPILGYSDSIRATIFTGAYPDEHGYWMEYCRRPMEAPMAPLRKLAPLDRLPGDLLRRVVKAGLSRTAVKRIAEREGYAHLSMRHLPFRALGEFDWTLRTDMEAPGALGMPTLFDRLTAAGTPWTYLDAARDGRRALLRGIDELPADTGMAFVYLHQIDMASHVVGIDNPVFRAVVRRTDALVGEVLRRFRARLGEPELVVFSDHGMSPVEQIVSYPDLWTDADFPHRFTFALDATMVRLWFHDDDPALRARVRARVAAGAPGRFLGEAELRELRIDLSDGRYGEEVYLLEPRTAIFPNFHSMQRPKAMHAYHPDDAEQQGIFIAPRDEPVGETVELVDVHDLCARLTRLEAPREPALRVA